MSQQVCRDAGGAGKGAGKLRRDGKALASGYSRTTTQYTHSGGRGE